MKFEYETKHLVLRVLNENDASIVYDFVTRNKSDFEKYEPFHNADYYTEQGQASILKAEYKAFLNLNYVRFYVFDKKNPFRVLGTVSYSHVRNSPYFSAILGYKIDKDFRKQHIGLEAVSAANNAVFKDLKIHRLECFIMPENIASMRFIERLGFKRNGLLEKSIEVNGKWEDHYLYSALSPNKFKLFF